MQAEILTFMIPTMTLILAGVFVALWWQDRSRLYILAYSFWFACVAMGIAMQAWLIKDFGPPEVVLFHAISTSGLIALVWGVAKRDGERVPLAAFVLVSAGTGAVLWFARTYEVQMVVIMAQNYNASLLFAAGAYGRWQSGRRQIADKALLVAFVTLTAYTIFRPSITMVLASSMTMDEYQTSVVLTVNMALTAMLCLLMSLALIGTIIADQMTVSQARATQDPLTGLPNRAAFEPLVAVLIERAASERVPVSLIVGDIDLFKRVNDTFGHSAGDAVIKTFAHVISHRIRPGDVAGRIGGEEFCVVAWNCDEAGASALADRLRENFAHSPLDALPDSETISASFGVAQVRPGSTYAQTFDRADAALYKAKRAGRNRVFSDAGGVFVGSIGADGSPAGNVDRQIDKVVNLADRKITAGN